MLMELVLFFAGLLAIAVALYMFLTKPGNLLSTKLKGLVCSVLIALFTALWCIVYGPDLWILVQAGAIIVALTAAGLLSSPKK
jgi:hypothetical protein